jgi:hypothetical protein
VGGGQALRIEVDGGRAESGDVDPGDGVGKVGEVVREAAVGIAKLDVLGEGSLGELKDLVEVLWGEVSGIGVEELEAGSVVDGVPVVEGLLGEAGELEVEVLIGVGFGEGQAAGDAVLFGSVLGGVIVEEGRLTPGEVAGESCLRRAGMLADVLEDEEVVLEASSGNEPVALVEDEVIAIGFELAGQGFAGLAEFVVLVNLLDELLESYGDDEADDDGGDVDEEVAPGVGGVVGWVDVEHGDSGWG